MEPLLRFFILLAQTLLLALSTACVSVNLKSKAPNRSKDYLVEAPGKPFEKLDAEAADGAWQNSNTGNTIAVLSECSDVRDPSLTSLEGDMIQALTESRTLKSDKITFEGREALRSLVEGKVDGVPVKLDVLTFKKNSCAYTLTYTGRSEGFEKDLSAFESFLKGFRIR